MSFNYLEVAKAVGDIQEGIKTYARVRSVELVEMPLPGELPDLNVAIRLEHSTEQRTRLLVFSLRAPWVGVFWSEAKLWRPATGVVRKKDKAIDPDILRDRAWKKIFSGAQNWEPVLMGQLLTEVSVVPDDRVVKLAFESGARLTVELFPARPNWTLALPEVPEVRWRAGTSNMSADVSVRPAGGGGPRGFLSRTFGVRDGLYEHYLELRQNALLNHLMTRAQNQLQTRLSQLMKIRVQMNESLAESRKAEQLKSKGEALKSVLHEYPKDFAGKHVSVPGEEGPVEIAVNPQYSLSENASRMFARYKKLQRTQQEVQARLGGVEERSKKITGALAKIRAFRKEEGESYDAAYKRLLDLLLDSGVTFFEEEQRPAQKKHDKKWEASGIRRFQSKEGLTIWVGRSHTENEELVIRLARGNDLWLHLKGKPGAHVVVQLPSGRSPSLETLLDAATLVAHYSGVGNADKVEVDYTFRKFVKRVPGKGKSGVFLVTYSQNKTLMVRVEKTRLERLMAQSEE